MIAALLAACLGVVALLCGLFLAASLIWSPLAGLSVVLIVAGAPAAWFGLTHDFKE